MPGRPILRKLAAAIAERANDPENDPEGEGYLFDRVVAGETLLAIAESFEVSTGTLLSWISTGGKPDGPRWRRYMEARELSAFCKEEEGAAVLAKLAEDAEDKPLAVTAPRVTLATSIAAHKRWQAEKRNRKDFGSDATPSVVLHVGTLHLDALRASGGPSTKALVDDAIDADYVIEGQEVSESTTLDVVDSSNPKLIESQSIDALL